MKFLQGNQIKWGIFLSYIQYLVSAVAGLIYIPILIRQLSTSEYGIYQLMSSFMSVLIVMDLGMGGTVTRYYSKYDVSGTAIEKEKFLAIARLIYAFITIALLIVGTIIFVIIEPVYGKTLTLEEINTVKSILKILVLNTIFIVWSNYYCAIIQAKEKFVIIKGVLLIRSILLPVTTIFIISNYPSVVWVYLIQLICSIVICLFYHGYCKKRLSIKIKYHGFDRNMLFELTHYSVFLLMNIIVDELYWGTDSLILGAIKGTAEVAIYGTASVIVTQYRNFASVIHGIFLPMLTKIVANGGDKKEINKIFLKVSKIQFFIVVLIASGFIVFGKEFISLWVGNEYIEVYSLVLIPMITLIVPLIQSIGISILRALNKQRFRAVLYLTMAVLNVLFSIPMCYLMGGLGCVIVTGIFLLIGNTFIMNIYYYKIIQLNIKAFWVQLLHLFKPALASLFIGLSVNSMLPQSISYFSLLFKIIPYFILYLLLFILFGLSSDEKNYLRGLLNEFI